MVDLSGEYGKIVYKYGGSMDLLGKSSINMVFLCFSHGKILFNANSSVNEGLKLGNSALEEPIAN